MKADRFSPRHMDRVGNFGKLDAVMSHNLDSSQHSVQCPVNYRPVLGELHKLPINYAICP